jgi:hypothetical protein
MELPEFLRLLSPLLGLVAPILVYLVSRQRLVHDKRKSEADEEAGLWERMSTMLDRYGTRADELEGRLKAAEMKAMNLSQEVATLRGSMTRWRNYALALVRQVQAADLIPLSPTDFGLGDED